MAEEEKKKTVKKKTTTKKTNTANKKTTTKKTTTKKTTVKKKVSIPKEEKVVEEVKEFPKAELMEEDLEGDREFDQYMEDQKENTVPVPEHSRPIFFIYIFILVLLLGIALGVCFFLYLHPKGVNPVIKDGNFLTIGEREGVDFDGDAYRVRSLYELMDLFPDISYDDFHFNTKQYIVFRISIDPCSEENVHPIGYTFEENDLHIHVEYTAKCGGCKPDNYYYFLELDKNVTYDEIKIDYTATNQLNCGNVAYKPILYFYPEEETSLSVTLGHSDVLTTTYPTYQDGWSVIASPDGTLKDEKGRTYYGLFWEGNNHPASIQEDGFVVKGTDVKDFLEKKLAILGLNEREANEFIIYWLPQLEGNPYQYIRFETMEEIDSYMPLTIQPQPDTMIRIQMDYLPLDKEISVKEQKLTTPNREGFVVVEWGGSKIKD